MCFFFSEWEIHYHSDWHSCIDNVSFFDFFKKSLSLNFKTFMMYLDLNFFRFILIGVFSLSLKSLFKFEKFLAIISLNIFSAPYSCSLSLGFWWYQESQGSVNFFFQSIFYCSNWLNSIDLSSIHRFCLLHIIIGPTQKVFYFCYCTFHFCNLRLTFSAWGFLFFSGDLLEHSYSGCFKIFCGSFSIWSISVLTLIAFSFRLRFSWFLSGKLCWVVFWTL